MIRWMCGVKLIDKLALEVLRNVLYKFKTYLLTINYLALN